MVVLFAYIYYLLLHLVQLKKSVLMYLSNYNTMVYYPLANMQQFRRFIKGTLMQIWKTRYMFVFT